MKHLREFEGCDSSPFDFRPIGEPFTPENTYVSNSNEKTFQDIMDEGPMLVERNDDWLRRNIRESMEKNADVWSELAKH